MSTTYFETFLLALQHCPERQGVLGKEYIVFPPHPDYGYESTPRNALTFGTMGVDGVHYAILMINGAVCDESPVVQICPMDFDEPYVALADSFLSYLAHGCGVAILEMEAVFVAERAGKQALVPFLKARFDRSRFWREGRSKKLSQLLEGIEPKP